MVYGVWCMVYGVWCMVSGLWFKVQGGVDPEIHPVLQAGVDLAKTNMEPLSQPGCRVCLPGVGAFHIVSHLPRLLNWCLVI